MVREVEYAMKAVRTYSVILAAIAALAGCATTSATTVSNPEYDSIGFDKIMVSAPFQDLEVRKQTEGQFVEDLRYYGVDAVAAIDLLPPIKQYSGEEIAAVIEEHDIDGVMTIALTDAYDEQGYVPPTTSTTGSTSINESSVYSQSTTTTSGGYYVSKPRAEFEVNLFHAESAEVVWKATSLTRGDAFSNYKTLIRSLSGEIVRTYVDEAGIR
jgi:hypothetical protein